MKSILARIRIVSVDNGADIGYIYEIDKIRNLGRPTGGFGNVEITMNIDDVFAFEEINYKIKNIFIHVSTETFVQNNPWNLQITYVVKNIK